METAVKNNLFPCLVNFQYSSFFKCQENNNKYFD